MLKILNKYEQAYENIKSFIRDDDNTEVWTKSYLLSLEEDINILNELVIQTVKENQPTLEEVKKEWEEAGWKWEKTSYFIVLEKNGVDIQLYLETKQYSCSQTSSYILDFIGIKEHNLITKTFRALGW